MDNINPETLLVPRGLPDLSPLKLDLKGIMEAEARIEEISILTTVKAPELMSLFNKTYLELSNMIAAVEFEYELSKKHLNKIKAIILIDKIPNIIKEKNLSSGKGLGSEDIRSAIVDMDPDYEKAQEKTIQLKCILSLLEGKKKSVDMAYTATKKVYGDNSQYRHSPDLSVSSDATTSTSGKSHYFFKGE
jgi:hypothetical protein